MPRADNDDWLKPAEAPQRPLVIRGVGPQEAFNRFARSLERAKALPPGAEDER